MNTGRVKVLHVVLSLEMGGMENGVVNIARGLPPDEFETHVACLVSGGPFIERLPQPQNVQVLHKPPGFSWRAVGNLNRIIRRVKPQVVHTHNIGALMYGGLATGFGILCPMLHGEHHLPPPEDLGLKRILQRKVFYLGCRKVHTVSDGVREELIKLGVPAKKMTALLNGVDSMRFQPGDKKIARQKIDLVPADAIVLGMVGRFAPGKGQARLVEAFDTVAAKYPKLHLLLVGSGGTWEEKVKESAARCAAASRIHFAGFQKDVVPYYQALDALVFPSTIEGLPNALLETMACGVPALAHPACGVAEIISHERDGWVAELDTVDKLKFQLEQLIQHREEWPAFACAAREKAVAKFSLPVMVDKYRQIYRDLAKA